MTPAERKRHAALAASQAAEAMVELLRFATSEYDEKLTFASHGEELAMLLDAAKLTAEVQDAEAEEASHPPDEERNQVLGAISRYLEGWAG